MRTRGLVCWRACLTTAGVVAFLTAGAGSATAAVAPHGDDLDPSTRTNVTNAMQGEALAHVTYRAYAKQADRENLPGVAALYRRTADTELREHFTEQAKLIGMVGDNAANLRDSAGGEAYEATTMYKAFAAQATADGDQEAAKRFSEIGQDEADHREKFLQAERAVTDRSSEATIPTDVQAKPVKIQSKPAQGLLIPDAGQPAYGDEGRGLRLRQIHPVRRQGTEDRTSSARHAVPPDGRRRAHRALRRAGEPRRRGPRHRNKPVRDDQGRGTRGDADVPRLRPPRLGGQATPKRRRCSATPPKTS